MPYIAAHTRRVVRNFYNRRGSSVQKALIPILSSIVRTFPHLFINQPDDQTQNLVIHPYKLIFVPIPKVASSSFKAGFRILSKREGFKLKLVEDSIFNMLGKNRLYDDYSVATVVRNPYSRVVSTYLDQIKNPAPTIQVRVHSRFRDKGLDQDMSFERYIDWLCGPEGRDESADQHWISQYRLLHFPLMQKRIDFVGKLENLKSDTDKLMSMIGIDGFELPNAGPRTFGAVSGKHRDFYNDRLKKMVASRYEADLDYFKYEF